MRLTSINVMLVPLMNSNVKRILMSNADMHYKFICFKLDTTFTTTHQSHLSFFFVLCIVHCKFTPPLYLTVCTNMKIAMNKNTGTRIFNRAPINFWELVTVEEDSTTNMILLTKEVTCIKST